MKGREQWGPGEHRPHDEEYWTAPWSTALFAGDLFEAIPFGDQPTTLLQADDGKHFVGEVAFAFGLLITPTCDMSEQRGEGPMAHPFRVLVPVLPLAVVADQAGVSQAGFDGDPEPGFLPGRRELPSHATTEEIPR